MNTPTPDQINERHGKVVYRCRACHAESGLHWYKGTSCPVCRNPECVAFCYKEWAEYQSELEGTK